jgi:glycosyltransferase involved in cell wall biosynthesis
VTTANISVIVPTYNEEGSLREFYRRTASVLTKLDCRYEIIFVNDGSSDDSRVILESLSLGDQSVRVIHLTRNFGHQAALGAGFHMAVGDAVIVIDADLQDPPELISQLVEEWRQGAKVVDAVRLERRGESFIKKKAAHLFYRLLNKVSDVQLTLDAGDFRLYDRVAVDLINALPERIRFYRGLVAWTGLERTQVHYERDPRYAGSTKYPLKKQLRLALEALTSFSLFPLRLVSVVGMFTSLLALCSIPVVTILRLLGVAGLGGQTTLLLSGLLFFGLQGLFIGILGHYIARINVEAIGRPPFVIEGASKQASRDNG